MSSASDVAAGFSISGLLDAGAKTRSKYPVAELDIDAIEDNPANAVYSMEEAAIEALAESIEKDGLTDLPLVRKLTDGRWQLISGHRRRAAFRLLAAKNPAYRKMGCRIVEGITDEQAVSMLHTANYFVRELHGGGARRCDECPRRAGSEHARCGPSAFGRAHRGHQSLHHRETDGAQGIGKDHQARRGSGKDDRGIGVVLLEASWQTPARSRRRR